MALLNPLPDSSEDETNEQAMKVGDAVFEPWLSWAWRPSKVMLWFQKWLPLIDPEEWWLLCWNMLVMTTILYNFL